MNESNIRNLLARAYVRGSYNGGSTNLGFPMKIEDAYKYADYDLEKEKQYNEK